MAGLLRDRVAIVTGSGQGIGRAIALAMAKEGARVVTNNRWQGTPGGDAGTTAREITDSGGEAIPFYCDVSGFEAAEKLVQAAAERFGRLDILVNNAISWSNGPIWELTESDWDKCVDSTLKGAFNCTRHACVLMKEQKWGRILNTTSISWLGTLNFSHYGAAKAGVVGLTRSVAKDMAGFDVTCNAFAPHAATRWTTRESAKEAMRKRYEAGVFTREQYEAYINAPPPAPETVPPLLVYLCTDYAAGISGQVFRIKGGRIAIYSQPEEMNPIEKKAGLWTVEELIDAMPGKVLKGVKNLSSNRDLR